jgi:hypothetical protein
MVGAWLRRLFGASVLCLLVGCGSSGSGSSDCDGGCWHPTTADQSFISSFCALTATCCLQNGFTQSSSLTTCTAGVQKSGFSADASLRAACLSKLQSLAGTTNCLPGADDFSDPCLRLFYEPSGPQRPAEPCTVTADCAGAARTVTLCGNDPSGLNQGHGICLRLNPGKAGDHTCLGEIPGDGLIIYAAYYEGDRTPPLSTGYTCARSDGLYCKGTSVAATTACAPLIEDGGSCTFSPDCLSGTCVADPNGLGSCAQTVAPGQACASDAVCDDANYCGTDPAAGSVCVAKLGSGTACGGNSQCATGNCAANGLCSAVTSSVALTLDAFCAGTI